MPTYSIYTGFIFGILISLGVGYVLYVQDTNRSVPGTGGGAPMVEVEPAVNAVTLAEQESTYLGALYALVSASSTVSAPDIEAFLYEVRVPSTRQEAHLRFAQSWANQWDLLGDMARKELLTTYYQSLVTE